MQNISILLSFSLLYFIVGNLNLTSSHLGWQIVSCKYIVIDENIYSHESLWTCLMLAICILKNSLTRTGYGESQLKDWRLLIFLYFNLRAITVCSAAVLNGKQSIDSDARQVHIWQSQMLARVFDSREQPVPVYWPWAVELVYGTPVNECLVQWCCILSHIMPVLWFKLEITRYVAQHTDHWAKLPLTVNNIV